MQQNYTTSSFDNLINDATITKMESTMQDIDEL